MLSLSAAVLGFPCHYALLSFVTLDVYRQSAHQSGPPPVPLPKYRKSTFVIERRLLEYGWRGSERSGEGK